METIELNRKTIHEQMNEVLSAMKPGQDVPIPISDASAWSNYISTKIHATDTGRLFRVITRRSVCPDGKAIIRRMY